MRLDTLPNQPFTSPAEHLAAEFRWLDARLGDHLRRLREQGRFDESELRGLRLDHEVVLGALDNGRRRVASPVDRLREIIDQRSATGQQPPLFQLADRFGLSPVERCMLLIVASPALDTRYRSAIALAQNDATRREASPDLLIEILNPRDRFNWLEYFSPEARLFRHRLIRFAEKQLEAPLADRALRVDDRIVMALLGKDCGLPEVLAHTLTERDPEREDWAPDLLEIPNPAKPIWLFDSSRDSGQHMIAARRAKAKGMSLLAFDLAQAARIDPEHVHANVMLACREAILRDAVLQIETGTLDPQHPAIAALSNLGSVGCEAVVFSPPLVLDHVRQSNDDQSEILALEPLGAVERLNWWKRAAPEREAEELAHLAWRSHQGPRGIGRQAREASHSSSSMRVSLPSLLRPVRARWRRPDLVVSPILDRQLDELSAVVSNWPRVLGEWGYSQSNPQSRHCLVLFSGPSGTGKTMAASIVASEGQMPLYRASLANIFDKYVGETEKQIDRLFEAAAAAGVALLCDEADALFGARSEGSDVHARYANLTVSHLLQRIEEHEGLVILTSNLPRNMDDAFSRRISHSLAFTLPDSSARLRLWRLAIPERASVDNDIDLEALADTFELSGGDIRNASLAAAYLAASHDEPIGMTHLLRAIEREMEKAGRTPIASDFGRLSASR